MANDRGTGRLTSPQPNMQNIPVRTTEGAKIRAAFLGETERGMGRTSKQIIEAPRNAMFLCPPGSYRYTRSLAGHLNRFDLIVRQIERDDKWLDYLSGYRYPVIVDHWVELTPRQAEIILRFNMRRPA